MAEQNIFKTSRRQFLTAAPACTLMCLAGSKGFAAQEEKHKFELEFGRKLTNAQFFRVQYGVAISLAKNLEKELGKDKTLAMLKKFTAERQLNNGQRQAKQAPDNSFERYVSMFRDPKRYTTTLTKEVVEDTDKVFELKVTECIWAKTFLDAKAADIGFAMVCYGDYAWAEGFNPKIKMVRDKTLMEGHAICNHRYLWTG